MPRRVTASKRKRGPDGQITSGFSLTLEHEKMLDEAVKIGPYRLSRSAIVRRGIELAVAELKELDKR